MNFKPQEFGLKKNNLYEILATTFSKNGNINPNTSCMGIRLIENNLIQISPYSNTKTFKNLEATGIITLNFVDNISLYALAALKCPKASIQFPKKYYNYTEIDNPFNENAFSSTILIPYVNKAWGILTCIIASETQIIKEDLFGESEITEFKLHVIAAQKFKESYKLFNRAENLALESIILATRLKIAKENNDLSLINSIYSKITDNLDNIRRFGKNQNAIEVVDLILKYIKFLID
ncbi:MAG: DUF447 domain-containing protein [Promethearchaeota archaeon]